MAIFKKLDWWSIMDGLDKLIEYDYNGNEKVNQALDACIGALLRVKELIAANPDLDDEAISELFRDGGKLPNIAPRVVKAIRSSNI